MEGIHINSKLLEIAVFNPESVLIAELAGVSRIELCADYAAGGITPAFKHIVNARKIFSRDIFVMIRCRTGNFTYNEDEQEEMVRFVKKIKDAGINGFVYGALNHNLTIDFAKCNQIIEAAHPLPVTFHRAFDLLNDCSKAAVELINSGFKRILTSGGSKTALEGAYEIKQLNHNFGDEIIFVAGGGVRSYNILEIEEDAGVEEFHSAAIINSAVEQNLTPLCDTNEIAEMQRKLKNL